MDAQLRKIHIRVERKQFTFDLKENPQGAFLRITEEVSNGRRNSIIIPTTGLELFRDAIDEVIQFNKAPVESRAVLSLGQPIIQPPDPGGSADLRRGN